MREARKKKGRISRHCSKDSENLGYVEGKTITFEHRFPNEIPDRFKSMAAELASLHVDVLVSVGNVASPYAKNATTTIPVVFVIVPDPVGTKLVENFARLGEM